ncbi:MAG: class I SAM-dependent methyltransferase [Pseudomonadales bacterium]
MSENLAHWPRIAKTWRLVGPPLRPSQHDLEFFNRAVERRNPQRVVEPVRALILGVTPELFGLRWPQGTKVCALDGSAQMIAAVWPGPAGSAVVGSWTAAPIADASQDVIVCDGGFGLLSYPQGQHSLLSEIRRLLVPGGVFIVRLFAPAGLTGSVSDIAHDLEGGLIRTLDVLKLRLWGALHRDRASGVRPRDVVAKIDEISGGVEQLVSSHGWPAEHVASLELHRNSDAVYHLTDAAELIAMAEALPGFERQSVDSADDSMGVCCPVVSLRRC